eukprot:gnl/MRDRNA2_/MRDRNA2_81421_c0_seq1.p1 gnl/MRDRNA2_/MRDRNA2_81421_c0~~gnl/MRDRNA2_/MRDRNA2_81421_c0_seq1.p1  ORF type:complete len:263 (+),score=41.11 gnl/MRDRNA2_/MRDRNA2_81421_c0_seq1:75-863(+)
MSRPEATKAFIEMWMLRVLGRPCQRNLVSSVAPPRHIAVVRQVIFPQAQTQASVRSFASMHSPKLLPLMRPPFTVSRGMAEAAPLSEGAAGALGSIKQSLNTMRKIHLSKADKRKLEGNIGKYKRMQGREEFHGVTRNKHGRIFDPNNLFHIVISSSKNNCWITVQNTGRKYRAVFMSHAGNVGFRKGLRKTEQATYRVAQNIARKLKRLGAMCADVSFRKLMKVDTCLQAFQAHGLNVTRLTHVPKLPKGNPPRPKKRRRV